MTGAVRMGACRWRGHEALSHSSRQGSRYAFDVSVSAPASVDVAVRIDTWYGAECPSILVSSHQSDSCKLSGSEDVCFERFPLLPAQRAGAWTVVAAKPSGPATTVRVVITFAKP